MFKLIDSDISQEKALLAHCHETNREKNEHDGTKTKHNKVHRLISLTETRRNTVMMTSFAISIMNCWKLRFSFPISNLFLILPLMKPFNS